MAWNSRPPTLAAPTFTSRVVPAMGDTIATRAATSRLNSVDLPTFGRPTSATVNWPKRGAAAAARARFRARGDSHCRCCGAAAAAAAAAALMLLAAGGAVPRTRCDNRVALVANLQRAAGATRLTDARRRAAQLAKRIDIVERHVTTRDDK
jgi:hypothetical protein